MKRMVKAVFPAIVAILCGTFFYFANTMPFGSLVSPGSGFMPTIMSVFGFFLAAVIVLKEFLRPVTTAETDQVDKVTWRFGGYAAACLLFILVFQPLGAHISIFLFVFALAKFSAMQGWLRPLFFAVTCSVLASFVFDFMLGVPLPQGIL